MRVRDRVTSLLNVESSLDEEMLGLAAQSGADAFCLVPENRREITTEGGLDVGRELSRLGEAVPRLTEVGGVVSLFVDPDPVMIEHAIEVGAPFIELHTGAYANASGAERARELERLQEAARLARAGGLRVNAGHGLDLENVGDVAALPHLEELNIGHALVAHALHVGVEVAIQQMLYAINTPGGVR